jgi:hypothetical protein
MESQSAEAVAMNLELEGCIPKEELLLQGRSGVGSLLHLAAFCIPLGEICTACLTSSVHFLQRQPPS